MFIGEMIRRNFFLLSFFILFSSCSIQPTFIQTNSELTLCYQELPILVHGQSMYPTISGEEFVTGQFNYYDCNNISRNDIAIINITKNRPIHIKFVKAIPGDTFEYKNNLIYVNGELLRNSENIAYNISSEVLELYSKSYPVLPENSYLIFGDQEGGSFDSSEVGLIGRDQIVGRVVLNSSN